ncbi:MAG: SRPBCC domain-containing protein [Phycisphaerales bacterium]
MKSAIIACALLAAGPAVAQQATGEKKKESEMSMSAPAKPSVEKRSAEVTVDIKATPEAVWKALTTADELIRWFPLEASVKPGVGGSMTTSWGEGMKWESPITIWEPQKRLRTLWCPPNTPEADLFGVDFFIEDKGGGVTRLRLVHFGFSTGAQWDTMYDGVSRGWDFMCWGLKNYLERHAGTPRDIVYFHRDIGVSKRKEAWKAAFEPGGLLPGVRPADLKPGDRFTSTVGGVEISGTVRKIIPDLDFQASIDTLNGAMVRIQLDPCKGGPGDEIGATLSTFGVEPARVDAIRQSWSGTLDRMAATK